MLDAASFAEPGINPPAIFGRQPVCIEREELLRRRPVAKNAVQEKLADGSSGLTFRDAVFDGLCDSEDSIDVAGEARVPPCHTNHKLVPLAAGVGGTDVPGWAGGAEKPEQLGVKVDRRATDYRDLDVAVPQPTQFRSNVLHLAEGAWQAHGRIGADRDPDLARATATCREVSEQLHQPLRLVVSAQDGNLSGVRRSGGERCVEINDSLAVDLEVNGVRPPDVDLISSHSRPPCQHR